MVGDHVVVKTPSSSTVSSSCNPFPLYSGSRAKPCSVTQGCGDLLFRSFFPLLSRHCNRAADSVPPRAEPRCKASRNNRERLRLRPWLHAASEQRGLRPDGRLRRLRIRSERLLICSGVGRIRLSGLRCRLAAEPLVVFEIVAEGEHRAVVGALRAELGLPQHREPHAIQEALDGRLGLAVVPFVYYRGQRYASDVAGLVALALREPRDDTHDDQTDDNQLTSPYSS
jgi:hypothetical protein